MKRVLVAEDETSIREFIVINLKRSGYDVVEAADGELALKEYEIHNGDFDIAILDIMMPNIDGLQVCKSLREMNNNIGIIMLSAKTQEIDKVTGLLYGADDYVTKPFSPSELMARVDAIYRRVAMNSPVKENDGKNHIRLGVFDLDTKRRAFYKNGKEIELTQVEFQIIEYFLKNPMKAISRTEILNKVWGDNFFGDDKVVDVNMRRLRMKIEDDPSNPRHLMTVWGVGYRWEE